MLNDEGEWDLLRERFASLALPVLALPRPAKRMIVILLDVSMCVLTVWLAYYLRLGEFIRFARHEQWGEGASWAAAIAVLLALPLFIVSGLYRAIFRYNGWPALLAVAQAIGVYGLLYATIFLAIGVPGVPRTVGIIQPMLLLIFVGLSRVLARVWLSDQYLSLLKHASRPKVLIYGAGKTGRQLAAAMVNSHEIQLAGFLDDDDRFHNHLLNGQRIYNPSDLPDLVASLNISDVLLAMPSLSRHQRNQIISRIREAHVAVRTVPNVSDLAEGKISVSDLRELDIDDLLGRDPVVPNSILLSKNIRGKVIMVTGAGGSIGSELCRQILTGVPAKLLLIEQSEFALYAINQELEQRLASCQADDKPILVPLLVSVQDDHRMREVMRAWHPNTVYHAAAYKHVPLVEHNPAAGIKNNVLGTLRAAQAAATSGVTHFVLISTDKAVRPTNVMGASKRLAEMALQALAAANTDTTFSIVRFGNVLGSSGSVVPKFRQQIRDGGPITLTHKDVTRYFMTIPEAAQLVIQAGSMAVGGDVFVLDMGQPVKIVDLARRMVELSGLTVRDEEHPEGDIEFEVTGLRPGEKLHEELLIGDAPKPTSHPRIMRAQEEFMPWAEFESSLKTLENALKVNDLDSIRQMMQRLVHGYTPSDNVDWVYVEQEAEARAQGNFK